MLEIIFLLWVASTFYLVFTCLLAIIGGHVTALLSPIVRFMTKLNSIILWSKALKMPLTIWNCVLSYKQKNYGLFFQVFTFIKEFPGSNFLPPSFLYRWQMGFSGSKFAACNC